jgi:uncharacterized protein (DUF1810 family)
MRAVASANDPYDLQRFVKAQDPVYDQVCAELRNGRKESHWMWFIFPQLRGLGRSQMATKFGIASREEAEEYLKHPILGPRLVECSRLVTLMEGRSIHQILGSPDDLKFKSSMSLFATIAPDERVFKEALQKYFEGEFDRLTLELL